MHRFVSLTLLAYLFHASTRQLLQTHFLQTKKYVYSPVLPRRHLIKILNDHFVLFCPIWQICSGKGRCLLSSSSLFFFRQERLLLFNTTCVNFVIKALIMGKKHLSKIVEHYDNSVARSRKTGIHEQPFRQRETFFRLSVLKCIVQGCYQR